MYQLMNICFCHDLTKRTDRVFGWGFLRELSNSENPHVLVNPLRIRFSVFSTNQKQRKNASTYLLTQYEAIAGTRELVVFFIFRVPALREIFLEDILKTSRSYHRTLPSCRRQRGHVSLTAFALTKNGLLFVWHLLRSCGSEHKYINIGAHDVFVACPTPARACVPPKLWSRSGVISVRGGSPGAGRGVKDGLTGCLRVYESNALSQGAGDKAAMVGGHDALASVDLSRRRGDDDDDG